MTGTQAVGRLRLGPGDHLPVTRLVESPGSTGRAIPDHSRNALVLLCLPHEYGSWLGYLRQLEAAVDDIQHWYSRVVVVVTAGDVRPVTDAVPRLGVATEAEPVLRDRLGIRADQGALLVVDRYGQIYHVASGDGPAALPPVPEIEEWVTFLATQCPECGVIDEPGYGEWAPI